MDESPEKSTDVVRISDNNQISQRREDFTMDERPAKRSKDQGRIIDDDRISQMPEHIIHNILSFLSARLGAQIRILSKTFRRAWDSLPIFDFDQVSFDLDFQLVPLTVDEEEKYLAQSADEHFDDEVEKNEHMKELRNKELFLKHLDNSFQRVLKLHLPIKTLKICGIYLMDNDEELDDQEHQYCIELTSRIDHWVGMAAVRYVEKLEVLLNSPNGEPAYSLPQTIVAAKSLTDLELVGCRLDHPFLRDTSLMFSSLRRFYLNEVRVDELVIQNLIRCCPLIEIFSLLSCLGLKYYRVYGLDKVKRVEVVLNSNEVENVDIVDIIAPSIQTLRYGCSPGLHALPSSMPRINVDRCRQSLKTLMLTGSIITDQLFQDVFSKFPLLETLRLWQCNMLERMPKINVDGYGQSLKTLTLTGSIITDQSFQDVFSKFSLLETLRLRQCNMLERIKISNSRLRMLELKSCRKLVVAVIDAPNLHDLKFSTLAECFISIGNVPEQTEVEMRIIDSGSMENWDTPWFLQLGEYLAAFKKIKCLTMSVPSGRVTFILRELRAMPIPAPLDVKHFWLKSQRYTEEESREISDAEFSCFLDGLFWRFHPDTVYAEAFPSRKHDFIKFLFEELVNHRDCCDNGCHDTKCWRHGLECVSIECCEEEEEEKKMMPLDGRSLVDAMQTAVFRGLGWKVWFNLKW